MRRHVILITFSTLHYAPTLEMQHFRIVSMRERYEELPSSYASYHMRGF
jgi:hypothetical protein